METVVCECACSEMTMIPLMEELTPLYDLVETCARNLGFCVGALGIAVGLLAGYVWWRLAHE